MGIDLLPADPLLFLCAGTVVSRTDLPDGKSDARLYAEGGYRGGTMV